MRRTAILFIILSLSGLVVSSCVPSVYAHHKAKVLGVATPASELVVPPVTFGPGYILPDSPLFFMDQLKQNLRLLLALSPEAKAKVHVSVAGERLAELRIMLSRDNREAAGTTLTSLANEMSAASKMLGEAAVSGKEVDKLAMELNTTIKAQRSFLQELINQADGSLESQIQATNSVLREAKIEIEDHLPPGELEKEIKESLEETEKTLAPSRYPTPTPTK